MRMHPLLVALLIVMAASCARAPVAVPLPTGLRSVAVFPPNNRTGDILLIAGASALEKYVLRTDRITVPDVLASEARFQLTRRGFTVIAPEVIDSAAQEHTPASPEDAATVAARNHIEATVLYIEVRRWEADAPMHPTFVIASVAATLIEPSTGRVVWSADHPSRPVPTPGVVNLGDAYAIAARTVMQEMLAALGPEQPAS